jgi:hypothetical protein
MFMELGRFLADASAGAAAGGSGLQVVEEEIDAVIKTLTDELTSLGENKFEVKAHIPGRSFGGGEEAPVLATHHTRAHGVVVDTLTALIADLEKFRTAVQTARRLLKETDDEAKAELETILARTEGLDLGKYAHVQAQVDHVNDTPAAGPTGEDA